MLRMPAWGLKLAVISGQVLGCAPSLCVTGTAEYLVRCIGMSPRAGMRDLQEYFAWAYRSQHSLSTLTLNTRKSTS